MPYQNRRRGIHQLFEVGSGGRPGYVFDYLIASLIVLNVVAVMLETVDPLYVDYELAFVSFERVSVAIFTLEYVGRLWVAPEYPKYDHPVWGRLKFALSPYMIIDLLAILPFYLVVLVDLRFLRALRLIRFLRLLKLTRYSTSLQLFFTAVRMKREELVLTSIVGAIMLLVASSAMYFAERGAQPEVFASIPESMYWGVITLTTVGYGDVTPVTWMGRVVAGFIAVLGVGMFALPASILASGFIEAAREETVACPHCGEVLSEEYLEQASG